LIDVMGKPLIEYHLENLAAAGFREITINLAHLGDQIREDVGDGSGWGLNIHYSQEPPGALDTGGGIFQALPLLGRSPFLVINGDTWTDYPLADLRSIKCDHAHLVLVPNPEHNPGGDFGLHQGRVQGDGEARHTFSGISVYHPRFFEACDGGRFSVVPLLREAMRRQLVTGEIYRGNWYDPGTIDRLDILRARVAEIAADQSN
jgi:MurNAc alpha-1-phosphate uridylyltransferase